MTISKCEHGKYLDMCRICFPLPEPSEAINNFAKEMTETFFPNGQVWQERQEMPTFKEFLIGSSYVLRFYKTDHVWTCTITEDMLDEVIKIAKPLSEEFIEAEWEKIRKAQEK